VLGRTGKIDASFFAPFLQWKESKAILKAESSKQATQAQLLGGLACKREIICRLSSVSWTRKTRQTYTIGRPI